MQEDFVPGLSMGVDNVHVYADSALGDWSALSNVLACDVVAGNDSSDPVPMEECSLTNFKILIPKS